LSATVRACHAAPANERARPLDQPLRPPTDRERGFAATRHGSLGSETVSGFLRSYLTVIAFGVAAAVMVLGLLGAGSLVRPKRPTPQKGIAYESGVDPVGGGWSQSQIRYYIFALLFVMFDVEAVFIFPWAVRLDALGTFGLVEMIVFIVILALGLVYAWRKGVLRWV
jgi:NADH:ubiquinone oxidoreductase subunit 3 (subunit A)